jgi:hypothetical protein
MSLNIYSSALKSLTLMKQEDECQRDSLAHYDWFNPDPPVPSRLVVGTTTFFGVFLAFFVFIAFLAYPESVISIIPIAILGYILTYVIHEPCHALLGRLFGCQTALKMPRESLFDFSVGVIAYDQPIPRWQSAIITIGPFIITSVISVLMMVFGSLPLQLMGIFIFFVNYLGSVRGWNSDLHTALHLRSLPKGTLIWDYPDGNRQFHRPKGQ